MVTRRRHGLPWVIVCGLVVHGEARESRPEGAPTPFSTAAGSLHDGDAAAGPSAHNASLVMFSAADYPHARCLDGSQFGAYIRASPANASAESKSSWLVVLNGGGLCTHESDCASRAKTELGTSTVWQPTFSLDSFSFTSYDVDNQFRDWNMVFVPYCSGDMHSGQRTTATNATFNLYFSGFHNLMGTVDYLTANHGLNDTGNTLVWAGGSAGGVGVFTSLDRVAARLPEVRVVGAPVGGFPPEVHWSTITGAKPPEEDVRTFPGFAMNNRLYDAYLPAACAAALSPADRYTCGVPHLAYPHLQTPAFIMESITDVVVLCGFEGMPCDPVDRALLNPAVWGEMTRYGRNATAMFEASVMGSTRDGLFAPSCLLHTGFLLSGPIIDDVSAVTALWNWLKDSPGTWPSTKHKYMDACLFDEYFPPCGKHCPKDP